MADSKSLEYTFRVAYLQLMLERRSQSSATKAPDLSVADSSASSSRKSQDGSFLPSFDLGSFLGRDQTKSPKYPEKLLKVLDGILQRIAMGQEPKYLDQRFRRIVARFWSSIWPDKVFQRQMKESRKIEDLILAFVTTSTKALQKEEELADGSWKFELSSQISLFLAVLSDCLAMVGPVSTELSSRLESYRIRIVGHDKPPSKRRSSEGVRRDKSDFGTARSSGQGPDVSIKGIAVETVAELYGLNRADIEEKCTAIADMCSEQAALDDLKKCLKLLNSDSPYPYCPGDFSAPEHWDGWRSSEVSTLSQMMLAMMQSNPSLAQSSDRHSTHDLSSNLETLQFDSGDPAFTYIPVDSRATYHDLLDRCLDADLEILKTLPEDEDVSLGILSQNHVSLLQECAIRWRLPISFRTSSFFRAIVERYQRGDVPSACVREAMAMAQKAEGELPVKTWAKSDALLMTLSYPKGYHSEEFNEAVDDWLALEVAREKEGMFAEMSATLEESIRSQAFSTYIAQASEKLGVEGSKNCQFAMQLAAWIEKEAKRLDRKFGSPITSEIDIVPLVLNQHLTLWFRDLEDTVYILHSTAILDHIEDAFILYRKALKLSEMGDAFLKSRGQHLRSVLVPLFTDVVQSWLDQTASKTKEWSDQALAVDTFATAIPNGPSSSVTDLFDSFRSAVQFLMDLKWPDNQQLAAFATRLAKIIGLSIKDYCGKMEQLFADDMRQHETTQMTAKQKAWLEKAKATLASLQGERKIQAFFNFTSQSCVKLNNIEAARQQLDKLYDVMRVDELSAYDVSEMSAIPNQQTYLFTVKIVLAEGLAIDGSTKSPDSFVIMSDEHGSRYAKTRTIYDDSDPRWDESFDIPVKGSAWFMATLRHRNLTGKHDLLGRAYLRLDPSQHVDLISKDVLLPLDTRGHILMRMTPVLRHTLSRVSIRLVLKPNASNPLDYNEALGKLSAAYRSAIGTSEYTIPPTKEDRHRGPTDAEIEAAIHPLFDYLDTNNHTLASTLSHDAMQMVMAKLWKQILMTIEALIVPPLSDKPSHLRALTDGELDIALKWLKFLRDFFYVGGDESGVPLSVLQNAKFNEILSVRIYYDWNTDDLMEECIRGFQSTLKYRSTRPGKSLLSQRNLGTIRARKTAKRAVPYSSGNTEMIMRILRMRQGTQEFLAQQLQTISVVKLDNPKKGRSINSRPPL
ncbi:uncharacterized protein IL334_001996 [Kwoniella shivajii]|uniref:Cytoplasmic protein n=1 Tax=Kwoniella shivajii TaxID=564305 RepID=A0ABZ1CUP4_9TREE|nr:hypothetical protein IL334_001996 [Kwoniella shivajii]